MDLIIRYGHFLGLLVLFAALTAEHLLTSRTIDGARARLLARLDAIYGVAAVLVLATGLAMVFGVGKGSAFYLKNGLFHLKLTLFVVIALLSLKPTFFFLRHRRAEPTAVIEVPRSVVILQRAQLALVLVMPLLAVLIARGVGLRSAD